MTFQSAVELVPMFSETFPANHFVALSDCIHSLYGKAAAHWIYFCSSRELSFTFNTYKLAHDFVIFLMSGRDDISRYHIKISRLHNFVQKGAGRGGAQIKLCEWQLLPLASKRESRFSIWRNSNSTLCSTK